MEVVQAILTFRSVNKVLMSNWVFENAFSAQERKRKYVCLSSFS